MESGKILLIDDSDDIRDATSIFFEHRTSHRVAYSAASTVEAEALIDDLAATGKQVDVAIVDGNLSTASSGGRDGEHIAALIHQKLPGVLVIGNSLDGEVRGADVNVDKDSSVRDIAEIIDALPDRS